MSRITDTEKDRRSAKKNYEVFDKILGDTLQDEGFTQEIIKDWAKGDPKGFMSLMAGRLPKVQPVDQDLQKTLISLKSMLYDLPDVEDIAKKLFDYRCERDKYKLESENKDEQIKLLKKKIETLREKCQAK